MEEKNKSTTIKVEKDIINKFTILSGELNIARKNLISQALLEFLIKHKK